MSAQKAASLFLDASRPWKRLQREDIVETVGSAVIIDELEELEILFLTIDEIDNLESCPRLRKLTLLDNGLKKISNLNPVGITLTSLCLCDQNITKVDRGLDLPNLRELFLHRNYITSIVGLEGCPRLRKLWLFQNNLKSVTGLHSVPELQECWLQANELSKLTGFEHCSMLTVLGLAGNPISDFEELRRLVPLQKLHSLSLSDIHFGRCPLADESKYKEFVLTTFKQIHLLDDVAVTKDMLQQAERAHDEQARAFDAALHDIEEQFRLELMTIDANHQSRETHSAALEREMAAALQELQVLVGEGRESINKQAARHEALMNGNLKSLEERLQEAASKAKKELSSSLSHMHDEHDTISSMFCVLERVLSAD